MFEGFKAKVYEKLETGNAVERMTFEQQMYSKAREKLVSALNETGIEVGDDITIESVAPDNGYDGLSKTRSFVSQYYITGTFDGKRMEFWFDETNVVGSFSRDISTDNFMCVVDGERLSEADAEDTVKTVWNAAFAAASLLKFDQSHST